MPRILIRIIIMRKTVIIGGGAAGLTAAYFAAKKGNAVTLLEKNEKLGKKIYITGKGRCNLTNDVDIPDFFKNVVSNPKFLYGAINAFSPADVTAFFENNGLKLKIERGNRVFPFSDKASDVTKTLEKLLRDENVSVKTNVCVTGIIIKNSEVVGVNTDNGDFECDSVVVCTGGLSYPLTGSDGDGYKFAAKAGHNIIAPKPSLTGITLKDEGIADLQGLSLKNVSVKAELNGKVLYFDFGEMLFTHYGVSGPIILSCSCLLNRVDLNNVSITLDLKPALDEKTLDTRLLREFDAAKSKELKSVMRSLLPATLVPFILKRAQVKTDKKCGDITKEERKRILSTLKGVKFSPKCLRPIEEAIVTAGGVDVKEINPKTMESKLVKGLFFAGEVIDVDCFTGGFNLQTAFSTGFLAGNKA